MPASRTRLMKRWAYSGPELFFEMGETEAGVDALAQDAAKMLVALDDYG